VHRATLHEQDQGAGVASIYEVIAVDSDDLGAAAFEDLDCRIERRDDLSIHVGAVEPLARYAEPLAEICGRRHQCT
jgi:hypothetical protein